MRRAVVDTVVHAGVYTVVGTVLDTIVKTVGDTVANYKDLDRVLSDLPDEASISYQRVTDFSYETYINLQGVCLTNR